MLWTCTPERQAIHDASCLAQLVGAHASLKGLTVVGDTAIFGINHLPPHDASRQQQQDAEVAVLNLTTHELISRTKVSQASMMQLR